MATAILIERFERFKSADFRLREGIGKGVNSHADVCAMQAVAWLAGESNTDAPECASLVIGRYVIRLNDSWLFRKHRDDIKPYLPRIVGSRAGLDVEIRRGLIAADYAVRVFVPIRLRACGRGGWADELESLPEISSRASAKYARDSVRTVKKDAASCVYTAAYAAAAAAEYAAAAAYAAAAVCAAAYAAAYAAADADAYAAADADADVIRVKAIECLDAMIAARN